jgi:hypothetical protein
MRCVGKVAPTEATRNSCGISADKPEGKISLLGVDAREVLKLIYEKGGGGHGVDRMHVARSGLL